MFHFPRPALFLLLILSGCGSKPDHPAPATPGESGTSSTTKTTLVLNWFPEMEHGGFYQAQLDGSYTSAGLQVEIIGGGAGTQVIPQVAQGRAEFGIENADNLVLARARGIPVVAIMAPIQLSPRCIIVHADSSITSFEQLENMTLAMNVGNPFAVYLQKTLPLHNVRIVPYSGSVTQFLLEKRFGVQGYSFSEPYVITRQGGTPRTLMLADLGFNPYTSLVLTSEETVRTRPAVVRAMARAGARGWGAYLANPLTANQRIHELNPQMSMEVLQFGADTLRPMCQTTDTLEGGIGGMTRERWAELIGKMEQVGLIEAGKVRAEDCFINLLD